MHPALQDLCVEVSGQSWGQEVQTTHCRKHPAKTRLSKMRPLPASQPLRLSQHLPRYRPRPSLPRFTLENKQRDSGAGVRVRLWAGGTSVVFLTQSLRPLPPPGQNRAAAWVSQAGGRMASGTGGRCAFEDKTSGSHTAPGPRRGPRSASCVDQQVWPKRGAPRPAGGFASRSQEESQPPVPSAAGLGDGADWWHPGPPGPFLRRSSQAATGGNVETPPPSDGRERSGGSQRPQGGPSARAPWALVPVCVQGAGSPSAWREIYPRFNTR